MENLLNFLSITLQEVDVNSLYILLSVVFMAVSTAFMFFKQNAFGTSTVAFSSLSLLSIILSVVSMSELTPITILLMTIGIMILAFLVTMVQASNAYNIIGISVTIAIGVSGFFTLEGISGINAVIGRISIFVIIAIILSFILSFIKDFLNYIIDKNDDKIKKIVCIVLLIAFFTLALTILT